MPPDQVDDKGLDKGTGDQKGDPGQKADMSGLEKFFDKLDGMADKFGQLEQKVNLIQQNMLSPDYFDKKPPKDTKPSGEGDKGKEPSFDTIPWDDFTNKELAGTIVKEFNAVLKGVASKEEVATLVKGLEDVATDVDVARTIVDIANEEDCSIKEAHAKFWALEDVMSELSDKFPTITASDAYKMASGKLSKPPKPAEKPEGDRKSTIKGIVDELRGGGSKPGGPTDLGTKAPADTRSSVTKRYEELFENK